MELVSRLDRFLKGHIGKLVSKPQSFKRLAQEDFKEDQRDLIGKLAGSINPFAEDTNSILDKGLGFDNLAWNKKDFTVIVDVDGIPTSDVVIKTGFNVACAGTTVIRAVNLTTPGSYVVSSPFISYTELVGSIRVKRVTGLEEGEKYSLRIILYV